MQHETQEQLMTAHVLQIRHGSCTVRACLSHTVMQTLQPASLSSLSLPSTSRHYKPHRAVHRPAGLPRTSRHYMPLQAVHSPAGLPRSSSMQLSVNSRLARRLTQPYRPSRPHSSHISSSHIGAHSSSSSSSSSSSICGSMVVHPCSTSRTDPGLLGACRTVRCISSMGVRGLVSVPQLQLDPQQPSSSRNVISSRLGMALSALQSAQRQMRHHPPLAMSARSPWQALLLHLRPRSSRACPGGCTEASRGSARALLNKLCLRWSWQITGGRSEARLYPLRLCKVRSLVIELASLCDHPGCMVVCG